MTYKKEKNDMRFESGTSSAVPCPGKRNVSSLAMILSNGGMVLVDCGEGTQHHIKVCTMTKCSRIDGFFLTHLHGDHCFGIFGLLYTMVNWMLKNVRN